MTRAEANNNSSDLSAVVKASTGFGQGGKLARGHGPIVDATQPRPVSPLHPDSSVRSQYRLLDFDLSQVLPASGVPARPSQSWARPSLVELGHLRRAAEAVLCSL